ncbi:hypothetical protein [Synechococcus sp. L2F]|uniref:hypothetical protein n=1 Tax=Synechococcus sp. L2F TaxID=2823739 RepID=UPI0020CD078A|nr:hypothetical protein [Synechococcus sp. L2F]
MLLRCIVHRLRLARGQDNATACAGELGLINQNQVTVEETNPADGITHHDQWLSTHQGKHQLAVQVAADLNGVVGRL